MLKRFIAVLALATALSAGAASAPSADSDVAKSDKQPGRCWCY
jgi:hypothetical protein